MDILVNLLDFFEPHAIYAQISSIAKFYLKWVVPIFFALSLAARYLETNTAALGDGASLAEAVKDVLKAIMWTAIYATFGIIVLQLEVYLCSIFYERGSLSVVLEHYKELLQTAKLVSGEGDFIDSGVNLLNFGTKSAAWLLFYLSFLLLVFIYIFMRLAYAIAFALLYVWGLAAIPTMPSKLLNISHGWTRGVIALFIWPLIEATILMLIIPVFAVWGDKLLPGGAYQAEISQAGLYLLFFFCNLIMSAVAVASALMAIKIANNENMVSGMVAPFAGAAMAGFAIWRNVTGKYTQTVAGPAAQRMSKLGNRIDQAGGALAKQGIIKGGGMAMQGIVKGGQGIVNLTKAAVKGLKTGLGGGAAGSNVNPNNRGPGD